jgi:anaerobic nitric oxide reductase flavorubredoxin
LRPKNRLLSAFGSYGWGGGAVKDVFAKVKEIGLDTFEPGIGVPYKPSDDDELSCYEFGRKFAAQLKQYHAKFSS